MSLGNHNWKVGRKVKIALATQAGLARGFPGSASGVRDCNRGVHEEKFCFILWEMGAERTLSQQTVFYKAGDKTGNLELEDR